MFYQQRNMLFGYCFLTFILYSVFSVESASIENDKNMKITENNPLNPVGAIGGNVVPGDIPDVHHETTHTDAAQNVTNHTDNATVSVKPSSLSPDEKPHNPPPPSSTTTQTPPSQHPGAAEHPVNPPQHTGDNHNVPPTSGQHQESAHKDNSDKEHKNTTGTKPSSSTAISSSVLFVFITAIVTQL